VLQATVDDSAGGTARVGDYVFPLSMPTPSGKGAPISLAIRPESIRLNGAETCDINAPADIQDVSFLGSVIRIRAVVLSTPVEFDIFNQPDMPPPAPGSRVNVGINSRDLLLLSD
jgi:putative spermidine/putrescine transport system ATP-binding protein